MNKKITIQPQAPLVPEKDAFVLELQRLLACYQLADQRAFGIADRHSRTA